MQILIIEDDGVFADALKGRLSKYGHVVTIMNNVSDATNALKNSYDVIFLDIRLGNNPDAGIEILSRMKKLQQSRTIVLSEYIDALVIERCVKQYCTRFIFKWLKEKDEEVFYELILLHINTVNQISLYQWRYRFFVAGITAVVIGSGIVLAWLGKSSEAGLLVSATGLVINILLTLFIPRRFR